MTKLKYKYEKALRIQKWNASFEAPPVYTGKWSDEDWKRWEKSREPLPPFEEWVKLQPVSAG